MKRKVLAVLAALATQGSQAVHIRTAAQGSPLLKAIQLLKQLKGKVEWGMAAESKTFSDYSKWCKAQSEERQYELQNTGKEKESLLAKIAMEKANIKGFEMHIEELASYMSRNEANLKASEVVRKKESKDFETLNDQIATVLETTSKAKHVLEMEEKIKKHIGKSTAFLQHQTQGVAAFSEAVFEVVKAAKIIVADKNSRLASLLQRVDAMQNEATEDEVDAELEGPKTLDFSAVSGMKFLGHMETEMSQMRAAALKKESKARTTFLELRKELQSKVDYVQKDIAVTKKLVASAKEREAVATGKLHQVEEELKTMKEYLLQVKRDCVERASEYQVTSKSRTDEVKVIETALLALADAAGSQVRNPTSFLQLENQGKDKQSTTALVVKRVERLAADTKSPVLAQLASKLEAAARYGSASGATPFVQIRGMIKDIMTKLERQEVEQVQKKKFCESELFSTGTSRNEKKDTLKAKVAKFEVVTAQVAKLRQDLSDLYAEAADFASSEKTLLALRQEEHNTFVKEYSDVSFGIKGVQTALKALRDFYSVSSEAQLLSTDVAAAMKAAALGSKRSAVLPVGCPKSADVIALLEVVMSDLAKQLADLQSKDNAAQENYEQLLKKGKLARSQKEAEARLKTTEATTLEREISELRSDKNSANQQLSAINEYLLKLEAECKVPVVTEDDRRLRQEIEIRGLKDALAILESS